MKSYFKGILLLLIMLPIMVNAKSYTYSEAKTTSNKYIDGDNFDKKEKYLIISGALYDYDGHLKSNSDFYKGGMLSKYEFEMTTDNGISYLGPGIEYWTLTSNGLNQYYIDRSVKSKDRSSSVSGLRVTEFVKKETKVTGNGSRNKPWVFVNVNIVQVKSSNKDYGLVDSQEGITKTVSNNSTISFELNPKVGYKYSSSNGCDIEHVQNNVYKISDINNDIVCIVDFASRVINYTLSGEYTTPPSPTNIYLRFGDDWYSNASATTKLKEITPPTKTGFDFGGYYTEANGEGTKVIDSLGKIQSNTSEISSSNNNNQNLYSKWIIKSVTCDAGKYLKANEVSCTTCEVGSFCKGGTFNFSETTTQGKESCPSGMTSASGSKAKTDCKITCEAGKYLKANSAVCSTCESNYYCVGGTYNFNETTLQGREACPSGMVSAGGSTAKTSCKVTCDAGNYLKANTSSCSTCLANNYCVGGTYNFNATTNQGLTACPSGYSNGTGQSVKTSCKITCNENYRVASADAKCTACETGHIKASHTVSAGSTSSCSPKTINVKLVKNDGSDSTVTETFTYGVANQRFGYNTDGTSKYSPNSGSFGNWKQKGKSIDYWMYSDGTRCCSTNSGVSDSWINSHAPNITLKAHWRTSKSHIYYQIDDSCTTLTSHTVIESPWNDSHTKGENNYWKKSNGSTYANLWYRGTTYSNIVYRSAKTDNNYKIFDSSLNYSTTWDGNLGLSDIVGPNGHNQYMEVKLKSGKSVPSGKEWKCIGGDCAQTYYNQATAYKANQFCDCTYRDCTVVLRPNCS